jgi:predicted metal-dependent peptidase
MTPKQLKSILIKAKWKRLRQIDEMLNPILPWYILLRDFVEKSAHNDYDWTRPSRRYIGRHILPPSLISEQLPEIVIAIDTSGSISQEQLSRFSKEASSVLSAYDNTIRVIYCDAKVKKEEVFTRADLPMKLKPIGGGGTNFKPVFEYVNKQNITPACLIYFTDLHGNFPGKEPEYPTMWLTPNEQTAPFGTTILFKEN